MAEILNINKFGAGKPIVFFHGWGFDQLIWQSLADKIKQTFTVYLVDLPGFGHSSLISWELFKHLLLEKLPRQFAVAGWSMGGLFAMRLAIENTCHVTHLFNIATSPRIIEDRNWPGLAKTVFDAFCTDFAINPHKTIKRFMVLQALYSEHRIPKVFSSIKLSTSASKLSALDAGLNILADWDLRNFLYTLNLPICCMFGQLDKIIPINTMKKMQLMYPNFTYVMFDKAGHMPFLTHQTEFITALERFMTVVRPNVS